MPNSLDDDALLAALGVVPSEDDAASHTPEQARLIAGFEDILRFHATHGRAPLPEAGRDIFERLYAVRLARLRQLPEALTLLASLDAPGLLLGPSAVDKPAPAAAQAAGALDEDALLAELGVPLDAPAPAGPDIGVLRHVPSQAQKQAAQAIAERESCPDFERFAPLFEQVERELAADIRKSKRFGRDASIEVGNWFILGGQLAYVAEVGEGIKAPNGERDARLRVVYANGTQSNLLLRSLQRALYKDKGGRRLSSPDLGPLFGDQAEADDIATGTLYVLRSQSSHPFVAEHRELIHKIGITGGEVAQRIAHAAQEATYLLAGVDVVATYTLHNIHRVRLENLIHRLFAAAQIDITLEDRFGQPVKPREWFLLPLAVIDEAVERIRDGSITAYYYDAAQARLVQRA